MHDDQSETSDVDQQIRINELRESAREAAGGEMMDWESPDCPPELAEQFWSNCSPTKLRTARAASFSSSRPASPCPRPRSLMMRRSPRSSGR